MKKVCRLIIKSSLHRHIFVVVIIIIIITLTQNFVGNAMPVSIESMMSCRDAESASE